MTSHNNTTNSFCRAYCTIVLDDCLATARAYGGLALDLVPLTSHPTTFEVKKSRFVSITEALRELDQVDLILYRAQARWPLANHYVYAYRLPGGVDKAHDDGEPHGTAGLPILNLLVRRNLSSVMVVVARYFGGTKLGHGGLIHAYQKSAQLALDQTTWGHLVKTLGIELTISYKDYDTVRRILGPHALSLSTDFDRDIHLSFRVSASIWPSLEPSIRNATNGTSRVNTTTPGWDIVTTSK